MKCTVDKDSFLLHLQKTANIVGRASALPILNHVRLEAADNELKLDAANLEIWIETHLEAEVSEPGATTLPAQKLLTLVGKFKEKKITLECDERFYDQITNGTAEFKLHGLDPADYPAFPAIEPKNKMTLKAAGCRRMISLAAYAASRDNAPTPLQGVCLEMKGPTLTAAATDGKRLVVVADTAESFEGEDATIIIPARTATAITLILDHNPDAVMEFNANYLKVKFGDATLTGRLIVGTFPHFR